MLARHRNTQRLFRQILATTVLCGSSYLLAHTVNAWVTASLAVPADSITAPRIAAGQPDSDSFFSKDLAQQMVGNIMASGLFRLLSPTADVASATVFGAPTPVSPLNLSAKVALIGIVLGTDGNRRAILEALPARAQSLYRVGQQVPEVGELAAIEKDRVLFRSGLQEEWLDHILLQPAASTGQAPPMEPVAHIPPDRRIVDRRQLAQVGAQPEAYLKEATFHPYITRSGQIEGFRLEGIRPVGVLDHVGLEEDDILAGINGRDLRDPGTLWGMFQQLPQERLVQLNVVRQGQPVTLTVEIR